MSEDIRIGILVRVELQKYEFCRPDGGVWISFSSSAIEWAGGIENLLTKWKRQVRR